MIELKETYDPPYNLWYGVKHKNLLRFKITYGGSLPNASALPPTALMPGVMFHMENDGSNYMWNGVAWDKMDSNPFVGATSSKDGIQGLVPQPKKANREGFLYGGGGWKDLDASDVKTGVFNLARIPAAAMERLVTVSDQEERFTLTTATVQNGDTVLQNDTQVMYRVVDQTELDNSAGYMEYKAARASIVPWSGVTNAPDFALDSNVVHKLSAETITGIKSFRGNYVLSDGQESTQVRMVCPNVSIADDTELLEHSSWASIQFVDDTDAQGGVGTGIGVLEAQTPSEYLNEFRLNLLMRALPSYAGNQYNPNAIGIHLRALPDSTHWVDTTHFMTHGIHPMFTFRNQYAPVKGTLPSGNANSSIYFADDDIYNYGTANHNYGIIENSVRADGSNRFHFIIYENAAGSTNNASIFFVYVNANDKQFRPMSPDINLGVSGNGRWKQLFATTATINTSDERLKTSIGSISDEVLDAWGDIDFVQFKFKDAVAKKSSGARTHSGIIAQQVLTAFESKGLDVSQYALFCHDSWQAEPEERDERGNIISPAVEAGDEYSLRYEEALCMEAAYQRRRAERAEARIKALEDRLEALEAKLA